MWRALPELVLRSDGVTDASSGESVVPSRHSPRES